MSERFQPARRRILKALGVSVPATAAVLAGAQHAPSTPQAPATGVTPGASPGATPSASPGASPVKWIPQFFNADETAAIDAIVARLIPNDDLGPGAREAGVAAFLDRQLAGAYGAGANFYRQGPFQPGTPEQGYQLALTPAECYRLGLAALDGACASRYGGKRFAQLDVNTQDAVLAELEAGKLALDALPGVLFFQMLLDGAVEGFFSDPVHGGNRDMVGWKLIGFPGAMASFANDIERHNVAYVRAPVSIATAPAHDMKPETKVSSAVQERSPVTFLAASNNDICRSTPDTGALPSKEIR